MGGKRFRWWHGCVVGLLAGIAMWRADTALEGWREPAVVSGMDARHFTRMVRAAASGRPTPGSRYVMEDLTVYSEAGGRQVVTARAATRGWDGGASSRYEFVAPVPFVVPPDPAVARPGLGAMAQALFGRAASATTIPAMPQGRTYPDVRAYLKEIAPSLPYRYAWWTEPRLRAGLWVGGPTLALGVVLPAALMLLVRLGLLAEAVEQPEVVLPDRPAGDGPPDGVPPIDQAAATAQLNTAIEAAERKLAEGKNGTGPAPESEVAPEMPPAVQLEDQGEPLKAPPAVAEEKVYDRGEYYPVSSRRSSNS